MGIFFMFGRGEGLFKKKNKWVRVSFYIYILGGFAAPRHPRGSLFYQESEENHRCMALYGENSNHRMDQLCSTHCFKYGVRPQLTKYHGYPYALGQPALQC